MTYSDVCSLIDQYEVIPPDHAEAIAEALARKGYHVHLTWGDHSIGFEAVPENYAPARQGTYRRVTVA